MGIFKDNLKKEINFRYNILRYKQLTQRYVFNRVEYNNLDIIKRAIDDLKADAVNEHMFKSYFAKKK